MTTCNICQQDFARASTLKRHIRQKHTTIRFQCTTCGQECCREDILQRHERTQHGDGMVECPSCSKAVRSDYLPTHQRTCRQKTLRQEDKDLALNERLITNYDLDSISSIDNLSGPSEPFIQDHHEPSAKFHSHHEFSNHQQPPRPDSYNHMRQAEAISLANDAEIPQNTHDQWTPLDETFQTASTQHDDPHDTLTSLMLETYHKLMLLVRFLLAVGVNMKPEPCAGWAHLNTESDLRQPKPRAGSDTTLLLNQRNMGSDGSNFPRGTDYHDQSRAHSQPLVLHFLEKALHIERQRQADGTSALELACYSDETPTIQAMIRSNADVNSGRELPLERAVKSSSAQVVEILLQAGAKTSRLSDDCKTSLHFQVEFGCHLSDDSNDTYRDAEQKLHLLRQYGCNV